MRHLSISRGTWHALQLALLLVVLLALAHNWAGASTAYVTGCRWVASQLVAAVVHATAPATGK